jgi:outer membrane scaffolding protein for murein synthesis (MipA/OmpV family)
MEPVWVLVAESTNIRHSFRRGMRLSTRVLACLVFCAPMPSNAGKLLDYIRNYDLNDYALGLSLSTSQNPYVGAANSTIAYPYLTSFQHSAFTDDWFLIRGENIGFRFVTDSDWEFGFIGRLQTLGLGDAGNDEVLGLEDRSWAIEAGPLIGWRRWPVNIQFRSYWEIPDRHSGTTSEIEFSLPKNFTRGYFVPAIKLSYLSDDYSDYYFGVSETETTATRPEYQPGAVTNTWVGFTLGYELSPKWLLSSTVGVEFLDAAVKASPIVERDRLWSASLGLAYNADLFEPRAHEGAEQQQSIEFRLGLFNNNIDTKVIRDAADGEPGDELDLEDFLGVADRETVTQFDAIFRVGFYHRLELGTFELRRRSSTTLQRDINFGDQTYLAGTEVTTSVNSNMLRLAYSYSLMRDRQKELGVTAGLSYSRFETGIRTEDGEQTERLKVKVPLPTIGVFGSVALGSDWRLGADIHVFALDFDRYEGFLSYLNLGLDRKFSDVFRGGIGYSFYGTRLKAKDEDLRGLLRVRYHGPKLYLSATF